MKNTFVLIMLLIFMLVGISTIAYADRGEKQPEVIVDQVEGEIPEEEKVKELRKHDIINGNGQENQKPEPELPDQDDTEDKKSSWKKLKQNARTLGVILCLNLRYRI